MTIQVVQYSTGMASAEVAYRAVDSGDEVVLITADTTIEDDDNWRFAHEVHRAIGEPEWIILCDGRNPMQVGRDERCVPNNRMAKCSQVLKRELIRRYMDDRWGASPGDIVVLLGFDWTEPHRHDNGVPFWLPFVIDSPLLRPPYWQKGDLAGWREKRKIDPPRLYETGAPHANCGGGCVRGGQVEWRRLLLWNRDRYLWWEAEEEETRGLLGKDVAILRHRSGPRKGNALSLREFRERLDGVPSLFDADDTGACGCDPWSSVATPVSLTTRGADA